jgi:two-component system, NarL family, nitrate/nitrite response regulator NarL
MIRAFVVAPTAALRLALSAHLGGADIAVVGAGAALEDAPPEVDVVVVAESGRLPVSADALAETGARAVVVVTDDDRTLRMLRGLPLRGWAIVARDAPAADLRAATVAAARGFTILPAPVAARLLPARDPGPAAPDEDPGDALTPREREVLELLAHGLSNRRIADALAISEHTAKFHVAAVCAKLGAASRTEAVSRGVRRGLITL